MPDKNTNPPRFNRLSIARCLFADCPHARLTPVRIDARWWYEEISPLPGVGFNLFIEEIYFADTSELSRWIRDSTNRPASLSRLNILVFEFLRSLHDYLHNLARRAIQNARPGLRFGFREGERANAEDMVFCLVLTEAAAVAALDYWLLSQISLQEELQVPTTHSNYAIDLSQDDIERIRRKSSAFSPEKKDFLGKLVSLYCLDDAFGIEESNFKPGSKPAKWLRHETACAQRHRMLARQWLSFQAGKPVPPDRVAARRIEISERWQRALIDVVTEVVWRAARKGEVDRLPGQVDPNETWRNKTGRVDPRFTRITSAPELRAQLTIRANSLDTDRREALVAQTLGAIPYTTVSPLLRANLRKAVRRGDFQKLGALVSNGGVPENHYDYTKGVLMIG